jgi:hypothetical protein
MHILQKLHISYNFIKGAFLSQCSSRNSVMESTDEICGHSVYVYAWTWEPTVGITEELHLSEGCRRNFPSICKSPTKMAIRKFPDCYCCNCLGERRWEGRPRSHFCKPVASVCHVILQCEHTFFTRVLFRLRVLFCLRWMAKSSYMSASSFAWSSVNPPLKPAFGEHSLSPTAVFEWQSRFKASRVPAEDDECSGQPSTSKTTENVEKNLRTHPQRPLPNNPWELLGSVMDEKDRNFGATTTGSFIKTTRPPTCPWKLQSLWLTTTWLSLTILPTCQT